MNRNWIPPYPDFNDRDSQSFDETNKLNVRRKSKYSTERYLAADMAHFDLQIERYLVFEKVNENDLFFG